MSHLHTLYTLFTLLGLIFMFSSAGIWVSALIQKNIDEPAKIKNFLLIRSLLVIGSVMFLISNIVASFIGSPATFMIILWVVLAAANGFVLYATYRSYKKIAPK